MTKRFSLTAHPGALPTSGMFDVWATLEHAAAFGRSATVSVWFGIGAPMERFRIAEAEGPQRADDLWETTCFEAFLRPKGASEYREWNFAPSLAWQAYDFGSYRHGMVEAEVEKPPYLRLEDNLTWWTFGATISVEAEVAWEVGISAVLEEADGAKSYWALIHPSPDAPDFHHPDCFIARLP